MKKVLVIIFVILLSGCSPAPANAPRQPGQAGTELPAEPPTLPQTATVNTPRQPQQASLPDSADNFGELSVTGTMDLKYATQFGVEYLSDGCSLITVAGSERFLAVPEGREPPSGIGDGIAVLRTPIKNIYLAATSAMCLFDALDALDSVTMSGTKAEGWYVENARAAMENGVIAYAGKYSAPDYEMIIAKKCELAIESTMILHTPEVMEKLEESGVPVFVERSSYEPHPLGRTEWIKLYGLLLEKNGLAGDVFGEQAVYIENTGMEDTGRSVAFFYINSAGNAVVRKNGDYVTNMIELAGGNYAFTGLGDGNATGSANLDMETFYAEAKDADVLIYNSSIDGEIRTVGELLQKSGLLADFKAIQNGEVWCTGKNLFQETTGFGYLINDMYRIFSGNAEDTDELKYLYRLR